MRKEEQNSSPLDFGIRPPGHLPHWEDRFASHARAASLCRVTYSRPRYNRFGDGDERNG